MSAGTQSDFRDCDRVTGKASVQLAALSPNTSSHTDTQQQVAAARHLLRAGGLQRSPSMSRIRVFQSLAVASAVLYAVYLALPHLGLNHSAEVSQILGMGGYGALPLTQHPAFYLSFGVAKLLATVGLVLLLPWGRWLLVAIAATGLASLPFTGVAIGTPSTASSEVCSP